jgi:hypothetical protein
MVNTRSVTKASNIRIAVINSIIAKSKPQKEELRSKMRKHFLMEGWSPIDRLFPPPWTFLSLRANFRWRTEVLQTCPAKKTAEDLLVEVNTFLKEVETQLKETTS